MEKENLESLLIDYIDGKLTEQERANVEKELTRSEDAYRLYEQLREVIRVMGSASKIEPRASLKINFEKALQEEINASQKDRRISSRQVFMHPLIYRAAAAIALILVGVALGYWINQNQQHKQELIAIQNEMEETKQMVLQMMVNPQSASQRMQGVNVARTIEKADDEVVQALVKTMNEDLNTNVRLAALEALSRYYQEPSIRKTLISALSTQKDPVVQIALIQLLVQMKEKTVIRDLEHIVNDAQTIDAVKDEAYSGLLKLS